MAFRKIAISIPANVLKEVDRLAKFSGTTRSGMITHVLEEVSHAQNQRQITEKINELFADQELADEQASTAAAFLRAPGDKGR